MLVFRLLPIEGKCLPAIWHAVQLCQDSARLWRNKAHGMLSDIHTAGEGTGKGDSVAIRGRITVDNSGEMSLTLSNALKKKPANLLVDLSGVPYIDTSGLATLLEAVGKARKQGTRLILNTVQDQPRYLLGITHLDQLFEIEGKEPSR